MSANEEWGEWQIHDGKGCPCVGSLTQAYAESPDLRILHEIGIARNGPSWDWSRWGDIVLVGGKKIRIARIIRYRIRKPRALLEMIERARELDDAPEGPARVKPKVGA